MVLIVLSIVITALIGVFFKIPLVGGHYGMYGGWGFEIFVASYAVLYFTKKAAGRFRKKPLQKDGLQ